MEFHESCHFAIPLQSFDPWFGLRKPSSNLSPLLQSFCLLSDARRHPRQLAVTLSFCQSRFLSGVYAPTFVSRNLFSFCTFLWSLVVFRFSVHRCDVLTFSQSLFTEVLVALLAISAILFVHRIVYSSVSFHYLSLGNRYRCGALIVGAVLSAVSVTLFVPSCH